MATLEALQTAVSDVLQDNVFSLDKITALINRGIRFCATAVLLPELESSGVVNTDPGANSVAIPPSWLFERNLYFCSSPDDTEIKVLDNFNRLFTVYPDMYNKPLTAPVERVIVQGNSLVYYPVPSVATELICGFYRKATPLEADGDIPSCLPEGTHEELLENFALWKAWNTLEDGIEGPKVNTKYYQDMFNEALGNLDMFIGHGQSRSRPVLNNGWV